MLLLTLRAFYKALHIHRQALLYLYNSTLLSAGQYQKAIVFIAHQEVLHKYMQTTHVN